PCRTSGAPVWIFAFLLTPVCRDAGSQRCGLHGGDRPPRLGSRSLSAAGRRRDGVLMGSGSAIRDDGPSADQELAGMLFAPEARDDPYPRYRTVEIPGCRHAAALAILKDPRLGPPALDETATGELMWTTFARWLLNLDGERHHRMRSRF